MNLDITPTGDGDFTVLRQTPKTETPRAADPVGMPPRDGARQGGADGSPANTGPSRPFLTGTRPGGSMADYDRLVAALEAYDAETGPGPLREARYAYLTAAADVCGRPIEEPPLAWSRRRVATYRAQMGESLFALACAIASSNSLLRAIGEEG